MHLGILARMLFKAPVTGALAFVMAVPWLVPLYFGILFAGTSAEIGAFAAVNGALSAVTNEMLVGNTDWRVPAWVDPFGWLPLVLAATVWLYFAQRSAFRLAGTARWPAGPIALVQNFVAWLASALLLPLLGVTLLVGGFLVMTIHEVAWPWHLPNVPSMPGTFGAPVEDFGRGLLNAYLGAPLALVVLAVSPIVFGARFMALHAAYTEGSNEGGSSPRLALMACTLVGLAVFYPVAAGIVWAVSGWGALVGIEGYAATLGHVWALHVGLLWCSLSAAAGFAARDEILSSRAEEAEIARRNAPVAIGTIAAETYGDADGGEGDDLARRLRAFEARQAA